MVDCAKKSSLGGMRMELTDAVKALQLNMAKELNGTLLDSVDAAIKPARTMAWKGRHPLVEPVTTTYQTGVKLTWQTMTQWKISFSVFLPWKSGSWISNVCNLRLDIILPQTR